MRRSSALTLSLHERSPSAHAGRRYSTAMRQALLLAPARSPARARRAVGGRRASRAGDGTLSVEDGRGKVTIDIARGGVIGRLDRGSVTIYDLHARRRLRADRLRATTRDGRARRRDRRPVRRHDVRFRLIGGAFRDRRQRQRASTSRRSATARRSLRGQRRGARASTRSTATTAARRARRCKPLPDEHAVQARHGSSSRTRSSRPSPLMAGRRADDPGRRGRGVDRLVRLALPEERRLRRARRRDRQRRARRRSPPSRRR